ncbi:MAG: hypothetical protein OSB41_00610 [Kiritimatiellae bacterium]|nr:hypothetical protein [Kiritimatiellia bacterium]
MVPEADGQKSENDATIGPQPCVLMQDQERDGQNVDDRFRGLV